MSVRGEFTIGKNVHIGDDVQITGNNVHIGDDVYISGGLRVGGGGSGGPNANLTIGDRCTLHNNFINLCEPVIIGNDVGLSPEVSLITHGFWQSVLEGYPRKFAGITIGDNTILGYRTTVLPGVQIGKNCVIGACSVVTKSLVGNAVYAGNPAKMIRRITEPSDDEKLILFNEIMEGWDVFYNYPFIMYRGATIDVEKYTLTGEEDVETDQLRDHLRHYGIKIYTERPF